MNLKCMKYIFKRFEKLDLFSYILDFLTTYSFQIQRLVIGKPLNYTILFLNSTKNSHQKNQIVVT